MTMGITKLALAVLLFLAFAASDAGAQGGTAAQRAKAKALGQQFLAAAQKGDWEAVAALYDPKQPAKKRDEFVRWAKKIGKGWSKGETSNIFTAQGKRGTIYVVFEVPGADAPAPIFSTSSWKIVGYQEGYD